jgi:hypothetical protein
MGRRGHPGAVLVRGRDGRAMSMTKDTSMSQHMFRAVGGSMIRASVGDPLTTWPGPSPDGFASGDASAYRGFVQSIWADDWFASAVWLASPGLAAAARTLSGDSSSVRGAKTRRAAHALARYAVRMRGRATPFGLFAGVGLTQPGAATGETLLPETHLAVRADSQWIAELMSSLEADSCLRRRLWVQANDLAVIRGDRIIVGWQPQASPIARRGPAEVSLRCTAPAMAALRLARDGVSVAWLTGQITAEFAPDEPGLAETMIGELMACGALISNMRPPSTVTDGLGHVIAALADAGATGIMGVLRDVHSLLNRATVADLSECATRLRSLAPAPACPVAVDLHASQAVMLPAAALPAILV